VFCLVTSLFCALNSVFLNKQKLPYLLGVLALHLLFDVLLLSRVKSSIPKKKEEEPKKKEEDLLYNILQGYIIINTLFCVLFFIGGTLINIEIDGLKDRAWWEPLVLILWFLNSVFALLNNWGKGGWIPVGLSAAHRIARPVPVG